MHEKRFSHKLSARKRGLLSVWSSLIIIISEENRFRSSTWAGTNFTLWKSRSNKTLEGLLLTSLLSDDAHDFRKYFLSILRLCAYWQSLTLKIAVACERNLFDLLGENLKLAWNFSIRHKWRKIRYTNNGKNDKSTLWVFLSFFFRLCRMWINFGKFLLINHG